MPAPAKPSAPNPGIYVQCRRCGHVPKGCPAMSCGACKTTGDNWAPKPMTRLIETKQKQAVALKSLATHRANAKEHRATLQEVTAKNKALEREIQRVNEDAAHADEMKEVIDVSVEPDGPETRARKSTLVQNIGDRRQRIRTDIANHRERTNDATSRAALAEAAIRQLQAREAALKAERSTLDAEVRKIAAVVAGSAEGGAAGPAAVPISADLLAALMRGSSAA